MTTLPMEAETRETLWPLSKANLKYWVGFLLVIQVVGIVGFIHPLTKGWFVYLTPFNLIGHLALLLATQVHRLYGRQVFALILSGFFAWVVEAIGVNTGVPFGHYWYGEVLGPKWMGTPVIIAINWLVLLVAILGLLQFFGLKHRWLLILGTGLLMTALDFCIEPVAMRTGMWFWQDNHVPFRNYLAWFVTSCLISSYLTKSKDNWISPLSATIYLLQWIFFIALYFGLPS